MVKVIKRPVEFEAWQYNGEKNCLDAAPDWIATCFHLHVTKHSHNAYFKVIPSEDVVYVMNTGDWIIRVPPAIGPVIEEIVTYELVQDKDFVNKYKIVE